MTEKTFFASPQRSSQSETLEHHKMIGSLAQFIYLFEAINVIGAVLDKNRQVVFANTGFIKQFGYDSLESLLGKRPGEAVSCLHSGEMPAGCGTSEACRICGAVNAIVESQKTGVKSVREASLTTGVPGNTRSTIFRITSTPVVLSNIEYYLLIVEDISSEKRKETLERIFFHDIMNIAGSLNGLLNIMKEGASPEETVSLIKISEAASRLLVDEIMHQRQIRAAENGDLQVEIEDLSSSEILLSAVEKIKYHDAAKNKEIRIDSQSAEIGIRSDNKLLQRILMNLLKNALEATPEGGIVNTGCKKSGSRAAFWVWNSTVIQPDIQVRIFERGFSTKGKGRGIGSYSIKLLTENYLGGNISFISNEKEGTCFTLVI